MVKKLRKQFKIIFSQMKIQVERVNQRERSAYCSPALCSLSRASIDGYEAGTASPLHARRLKSLSNQRETHQRYFSQKFL